MSVHWECKVLQTIQGIQTFSSTLHQKNYRTVYYYNNIMSLKQIKIILPYECTLVCKVLQTIQGIYKISLNLQKIELPYSK